MRRQLGVIVGHSASVLAAIIPWPSSRDQWLSVPNSSQAPGQVVLLGEAHGALDRQERYATSAPYWGVASALEAAPCQHTRAAARGTVGGGTKPLA